MSNNSFYLIAKPALPKAQQPLLYSAFSTMVSHPYEVESEEGNGWNKSVTCCVEGFPNLHSQHWKLAMTKVLVSYLMTGAPVRSCLHRITTGDSRELYVAKRHEDSFSALENWQAAELEGRLLA